MCEKYLYGSEGGAGHDRPYPYPRQSKRCCEATIERSGRGGRFGEIFRPKHFAELTTPSAPLRWLRDFLITGAATPPFQGGEKSPLRSSILRAPFEGFAASFFVATTNKC